jgi:glycosyltransferase involved in cell wall biosynthesis
MKPVLEGTVAAYLAGVPSVVNALAGLGYIFTASSIKARLLKLAVVPMLKALLHNGRVNVIFQNRDDLNEMVDRGIAFRERTTLIRGSGVDTKIFVPTIKHNDVPIVLLASRMLWSKGVGKFVELARMSKRDNIAARFVLVGEPDPENHDAVSLSELESWNESGVVEWWGKRENMPEVFGLADIVCLPTTYGEGVPKVLIEAAACGLPIVTTDVPGCREIVQHDVNGFLLPPGDIGALFGTVKSLLEDSTLRSKMGSRGRALVISDFSIEHVIEQTLNLYHEIGP